jgi:hypothetical protein
VVGFVLPDLHQAHKNLHTTIACKNQNAAIKVRVKWNSSILKFDINYKVLECKKVMESIYSRIKHWRDCLLHSEGKFGYFFKLTDTELVAARYTLYSSMVENASELQYMCDFSSELKQFQICESFVFGLKSTNGVLGYIFKALSHGAYVHRFNCMEKRIRRKLHGSSSKALFSLLSFDKLCIVSDEETLEYCVFERLHQISRDVAKQCLWQLLMCQCCNVRYSLGFKLAISFGRNSINFKFA